MIWRISFSKISDLLPALTCAITVVNIWFIYLGDNNLRFQGQETLVTQASISGWPVTSVGCNENFPKD